MPAWVIPAVTAAAGLISQGIAKGKDARQLNQQEKLNQLQMKGEKEMMQYGMGLQKQMWEDTGYGAQKDQMKRAGINPALMYGMGGGGGQTVGNASGAPVAGGMAPAGSGSETETMGAMGMQMAQQINLMKAQEENIKADTENKKQETQVGIAQVGKTYAEGERATVDVELIKRTMDAKIQQITGESKSAWAKGEVDVNTVNEQVAKVVNESLQSELQKQNIQAETAKKLADVAQGWKDLDIKERQLKLNEFIQKEGLENKDQDQIIQIINTILGVATRGIIHATK